DDGDGIQDLGELPLEGAEVTLTIEYPDGSVVNVTTVSDLNGAYSFGNLMLDEDELGTSGNEPVYTITAVPPADLVPTQTNVGNPQTDSDDPNGATATPVKGGQNVALQGDPLNEPTYASVDFGFHAPLFIGDRVFSDLDDDGEFDPTQEEGISGVLVELLDVAGNPIIDVRTGLPITAVTNEQGFYLLSGVSSGEFIVRIAESNFDEPTDPLYGYISSQQGTTPDPNVDPAVDFDDNGVDNLDPAAGGVQSLPIEMMIGAEPLGEDGEDGTVPDANSNRSVDFGFFELLTLGNRVWNDENRDGIIDPSEVGLENVQLSLFDESGNAILNPVTNQPVTAVTDGDGVYLFTNLFPGEYVIRIDPINFRDSMPLEDFFSTEGNVDPDDNEDSDDNGIDTDNPDIDGISSLPILLTFAGEPDGGLDGDNNDNTNFTVDFALFNFRTAVDVVLFTAVQGTDNQVVITWVTQAEINVFGYDIYRNNVNDFDSAEFIHNETSTGAGGTTYRYVDTIPNDGDWYYWLVPIETGSNRTPPFFTKLSKSVLYLPIVVSGE
ncbi:MAG: SdrD B-like domain-containing protein, partial [Chloroflexota bacterium]